MDKAEFENALEASTAFSALKEEVAGLKQDVVLLKEVRKGMEGGIATLEKKITLCRRDVDKGLKRMDQAVDRLENLGKEMTKITVSFDDIYSDLRLKATQQDLNSLENSLRSYCPISLMQQLQYDVDSKASLSAVEDLSSILSKLPDSLYADFPLKTELRESVQNAFEEVKEMLAEYVKERDCLLWIKESSTSQQPRIKEITETVTHLTRQNKEIAAYIEDLKANLQRKAGFEDLEEINERLKGFSRTSDCLKVGQEISKFEQQCAKQIAEMAAMLRAQEAVLARYDEVLLEKASKLDLQSVNERLRSYCKSADVERKMTDLDSYLQAVSSESSSHGHVIRDLESNLSDVLQAAKSVRAERREFSVMKEMIEELYAIKADRVDLLQLGERKASIDEFHQTLQCVDILHRLMKMCAVLISHWFKGVPKAQDPRYSEVARREWLCKHAEMVVKWATEFSPLQPDLKLPEEMWVPPTPSHSPAPQTESPNVTSTHRRLKTRQIKLPSIDTTF